MSGVAIRRVHAGYYVSRSGRWTLRASVPAGRKSWTLKSVDGEVTEEFFSLRAAKLRAAELDAQAAAKARPSSAPEVARLTLTRVEEHRDHWKAVDENGRVMSTGALEDVARAISKHWPTANVEMEVGPTPVDVPPDTGRGVWPIVVLDAVGLAAAKAGRQLTVAEAAEAARTALLAAGCPAALAEFEIGTLAANMVDPL